MIPITGEEFLRIKDKKDEIYFHLQYVTSKIDRKFHELQRNYSKNREQIEKLEKNIEENNLDELNNSPMISIEDIDNYIDLFIVGWSGKDAPTFPTDRRVSECFAYADKFELFSIITSNIDKLISNTKEEVKN